MSTPLPRCFSARRMDDCHRAIHEALFGDKAPSLSMTNFISIVESPEFHLPSTAVLDGAPLQRKDVECSFRALHPEYDEKRQWNDAKQVLDKIMRVRPSFRFLHGPRLFSIPGLHDVLQREDFGPIQWAVDNLGGDGSRAYVGLFSPDLDLASRAQPLPALVGVHFVQEGKYLDLVATFRSLELSFWWTVNMFEAIQLLEWAASRRTKITPRRITFFSPVAGWNATTRSPVPPELDSMSVAEIGAVVKRALSPASKAREAREVIIRLLADKASNTHHSNLDAGGLRTFCDLVKVHDEPHRLANVLAEVQKAIALIEDAVNAPDRRRVTAKEAKQAMDNAILLFRAFWKLE